MNVAKEEQNFCLSANTINSTTTTTTTNKTKAVIIIILNCSNLKLFYLARRIGLIISSININASR